MKTIVYVDAFNLYYGSLRGTPYKWLDLDTLCRVLLPRNEVIEIKYFTARVKSRPSDPSQHRRQATYLRALATLPHCSVHFGHFLSHNVSMPLVHPQGSQRNAYVIKTEEKGSDVNIATHLLMDAYEDRCAVHAIISNDSDLLMPISVLRRRLKKTVGVLCPQRLHPSQVLSREAHFFKRIREAALKKSQFPNTLGDSMGRFTKPSSW